MIDRDPWGKMWACAGLSLTTMVIAYMINSGPIAILSIVFAVLALFLLNRLSPRPGDELTRDTHERIDE